MADIHIRWCNLKTDVSIKVSCLLAVMCFFMASPVAAEIFKWMDDNGKVHFGDRPPAERKVEKVNVKINSYSSVEIVPFEASVSRNIRRGKVVMYSTVWCGYCKKARRYFRENNIPFQEYDTETSNRGKADYQRLKGTGVPIILVGEKRMNGFSPSGFERLYQ
ncbi:hypothetical protein MNBD_GAMMA17-445 [hydrothermal vent metagenome]|uniref:Uncharacterized protein n=1 Tax=hydrothermal vent metagenome TaxID=652676 RepID=A0A3B1AC68_9ZZZZ